MSSEVLINFLNGIPLFSNLGPVPLARLAENAITKRFSKGASVVERGTPCSYLYVVVSGKLEAYRKTDENSEIIIQVLSPGEIFGEDSVMDGSPLSASLRAAQNSVVLSLDRQTLNITVRDNTELSKNYIKQLGGRVRNLIGREENLISILLSVGLQLPDTYSVKADAKQEVPPVPTAEQISPVNTPEDLEDGGDGNDLFFKKEFNCPLCSQRFQTLKPRQKHIIVEKADDDFCLYYKTVNPLHYEINICPKCGYSFNNSTYGPVKAEFKKSLTGVLSGLWKGSNYCGMRTPEDAVQSFKLAIECQRLLGADDSNMGRFYLKLGWLYRNLGLQKQEHPCLEKALNYLSKSFESSTSNDPKEEMNLMFLLGQLHLILNDDHGAVNWFVRIAHHPEKKSYPYIVNRSRDTWQDIRQKKEGLPKS